MANCSYLPQFPLHAATIMLPVNILLQYKKHFAKVLISTLFFKLLNMCNLLFFQKTSYIILCKLFNMLLKVSSSTHALTLDFGFSVGNFARISKEAAVGGVKSDDIHGRDAFSVMSNVVRIVYMKYSFLNIYRYIYSPTRYTTWLQLISFS